ncbi:MAG: response regulator, partial [bacterium]|nr:response regulator [bacterium]
IDDEDFIRELVKDFLELEDILCDGAETAETGLDLISKNSYDLVLLDRNLGKSKAEDIVVKIRDLNNTVPVVILTGDADCDDEYQKNIGAQGVVFKPFQVVDFMGKVNEFLELK